MGDIRKRIGSTIPEYLSSYQGLHDGDP